jgi:uncharacterized membrane protein
LKTDHLVRRLTLALVAIILIILGAPSLAQETKPGLSLRLISSDYSNPVRPGSDNAFRLVLTNTGKGTITNIRLSSFQPKDWVVEFNPTTVSQIPENGLQNVDVTIRPPENAGRGYQNINITAQAAETNAIIEFSVDVEGGTSVWLWIGIALAAVVLGGFVYVFIRMGRQ